MACAASQMTFSTLLYSWLRCAVVAREDTVRGAVHEPNQEVCEPGLGGVWDTRVHLLDEE